MWDFYLFWGDPALHHFVVLAFVIGNANVILQVIGRKKLLVYRVRYRLIICAMTIVLMRPKASPLFGACNSNGGFQAALCISPTGYDPRRTDTIANNNTYPGCATSTAGDRLSTPASPKIFTSVPRTSWTLQSHICRVIVRCV